MSMVWFFGGTSLVETTYLVTDIKEVTQGIAIPLKQVNKAMYTDDLIPI